MSVGYGPLFRIDGPQPQPPTYTLLGAANIVEDVVDGGTPRWANGVAVYPYPEDLAHRHDPCSSGTSRTKAVGGALGKPEFAALTVYLTETCNSYSIFGEGMSNEEAQTRFVARARATFGAVEAAAVERELLAADCLGLNPHLADGNGTFPWGDTATTVVNAFTQLELSIAKSGRRGMIHCSPGLATVAHANRVLHEDSRTKTLCTINGTVAVPGYGYAELHSETRTHPPGHAVPSATQEWAYATGPVEIRRTEALILPENLSQALDRANNVVEYRVERYYVTDWDQALQASVLVDLCTTSCGSPS